MLSKGNLVVIILMLFPLSLLAQQSNSGFTVHSNPAGAEVLLKGDLILSGISPVSFTQGIQGKYRVIVKKYGYETYHSSVYLQTDRSTSLDVQLKPKTRFKALARSFLIPGWGQYYSDQKFKGGCFFVLAAGAVGAYFITDAVYDDKVHHYDNTLSRYQRATLYDEKWALYQELTSARKDAYDAENLRRITIGVGIAVWGLNLLDLLFSFPEESGSYSVNSLSFKPDINNGGGTIQLTHRF
jgi:hypothetical protein